MNVEFEVAHELTSAYGSIFFNVPEVDTSRVWRLSQDSYKMIPSLRVTQDNVSQADGSVLHPRYTSGLTFVTQVAYNIMIGDNDFKPACGNDLREMNDELILHLNALRKTNTDDQRLYWTPTGLGDRQLLQNVELLAIWDPTYDLGGVETLVSFALETPFPYLIKSTQHSTPLDDGDTVTLTNIGNAEFSPVIHVAGGTGSFTITNESEVDEDGNPLQVVYDIDRPGAIAIPGGHYGEIDFFKGSIIEDGDGDELIAGIAPGQTDFFHLIPGANDISIDGADCTILWNDAWA